MFTCKNETFWHMAMRHYMGNFKIWGQLAVSWRAIAEITEARHGNQAMSKWLKKVPKV